LQPKNLLSTPLQKQVDNGLNFFSCLAQVQRVGVLGSHGGLHRDPVQQRRSHVDHIPHHLLVLDHRVHHLHGGPALVLGIACARGSPGIVNPPSPPLMPISGTPYQPAVMWRGERSLPFLADQFRGGFGMHSGFMCGLCFAIVYTALVDKAASKKALFLKAKSSPPSPVGKLAHLHSGSLQFCVLA